MLDDPALSTSPVQLITWPANGGPNQSWVLTHQLDGQYQIKNLHSGLCLENQNGSTAGNPVIQDACGSGPEQRWLAIRQTNNTYTFANIASGLVMTTASTSSSALVTQQTANLSNPLQQWTIS